MLNLGSMPDWVQIAIAVLSLGGGAWGGGFAAALSRVRLGDRRRLIQQTRDFANMFAFAAAQERVWAYAQPTTTGEDEWEWFSGQAAQIQQINETLRLLPWKDRWAWELVASRIPKEWSESIRQANDYRILMAAAYPSKAEKERMLSESGFQNTRLPILEMAQKFSWVTDSFVPEFERFQQFESDHVNPSWLGRWRRRRHIVRLVGRKLGGSGRRLTDQIRRIDSKKC